MDVISKEQALHELEVIDTDLTFGPLTISASRRMVCLNVKKISLTTIEFDILHFMASHPGQVFTMKQLYESTIHEPYFESYRTVSSAIYRIRRKIGSDAILNVHGYGYKFDFTKNETVADRITCCNGFLYFEISDKT